MLTMPMQVGLAGKDMLAREPDLTLYRQLSCFTLQVSFSDDHRPRQHLGKGCGVEAVSDEGCEHVQAGSTPA